MPYLEIGICADCKEPYKKRAGNQVRCGSRKYKRGCAYEIFLKRAAISASHYYKAHPEKRREIDARKRAKPAYKAWQKKYMVKWKAAHPDYFPAYQLGYVTRNKDKIRTYQKKYHQTYVRP